MASRWPQDNPKTAERGPKIAQDGPKMAPLHVSSFLSFRSPEIAQDGPKRPQEGPRSLQIAQDGPKLVPRLLKHKFRAIRFAILLFQAPKTRYVLHFASKIGFSRAFWIRKLRFARVLERRGGFRALTSRKNGRSGGQRAGGGGSRRNRVSGEGIQGRGTQFTS